MADMAELIFLAEPKSINYAQSSLVMSYELINNSDIY